MRSVEPADCSVGKGGSDDCCIDEAHDHGGEARG